MLQPNHNNIKEKGVLVTEYLDQSSVLTDKRNLFSVKMRDK